MFLKFSSVTLLSLAAPLIVAGGASADTAERSLQASTLLSCLEFGSGLSIRDGCSCHDIATACRSRSDLCDLVGECCVDDVTTTTNLHGVGPGGGKIHVARRRLAHPR